MKFLIGLSIICILLTSCGGRNKDNILEPGGPGPKDGGGEIYDSDGPSIEEEVNKGRPQEVEETIPKVPPPKMVSELFQDLKNGVFVVKTILGEEFYTQGSGFFIAKGIGITNYHVLQGSDQGFIVLSPDNVFPITRILSSSPPDKLDYVIFETDVKENISLSISKRNPEIGEDVFAIGTPKGLNNSLTKGTISGIRKNQRIQIDATIDHGSSGGPLFNLQGEVIGITTSGVGTGSELNFAVNIQALPYERYIRN